MSESSYYILKEQNKIWKKFVVSASNERHSSGDIGTILEYTNVPGPNQSGLSWDRPLWTHNTVCIPPGEQFVCIVC